MSIQSPRIELETGEPELRQVQALDSEGLTLPEPEMKEEEEDGNED